jgi:hypothetical protein
MRDPAKHASWIEAGSKAQPEAILDGTRSGSSKKVCWCPQTAREEYVMGFLDQLLRCVAGRLLIVPESSGPYRRVRDFAPGDRQDCTRRTAEAAQAASNVGLRFLLISTVVGSLATSEASAHRDRGPDDLCRRQVGSSFLHLTLYQPQFDPAAEYCEEVPRPGKTIVVVDFTTGPLRATPLSLELIETARSGESVTLLSLPSKTYELGVVDTDTVLNEGHDYRVLVLLETKHETQSDVLVFPIRVSAWYRAIVVPALVVGGLLALMAMSVIRYLAMSRREESVAVWASRRSNEFA